jgi:hypothetical protein
MHNEKDGSGNLPYKLSMLSARFTSQQASIVTLIELSSWLARFQSGEADVEARQKVVVEVKRLLTRARPRPPDWRAEPFRWGRRTFSISLGRMHPTAYAPA